MAHRAADRVEVQLRLNLQDQAAEAELEPRARKHLRRLLGEMLVRAAKPSETSAEAHREGASDEDR